MTQNELADKGKLNPIPERELWLWQNPEALAAVREGMAQAVDGEVHYIGSFAQFADLEIED